MRRPPFAHAASGAAVLLSACLALGACSSWGGTPADPDAGRTTSGPLTDAASPAPTPSAPVDPADPAVLGGLARTGTPVPSGVVTLTVAALEPVGVVAQDDGSAVVTFAITADETAADDTGGAAAWSTATAARRVAAVLAAPSGLTFAVETDRSVTVTGPGGAVVGALPALAVTDAAGARVGSGLAVRAGDATLLDVLVDPRGTGTASLTFGATPLVSAVWGENEGGRSLAVVPAVWVRAGSRAAQDALWAAVVAAEPDADSVSMHDQLGCHALGAPTKASWNLEPWRPEVDSFTLLVARCNP